MESWDTSERPHVKGGQGSRSNASVMQSVDYVRKSM